MRNSLPEKEDIPKGYEELAFGELIQEGDKIWNMLDHCWEDQKGQVGENSDNYYFVIRKVK